MLIIITIVVQGLVSADRSLLVFQPEQSPAKQRTHTHFEFFLCIILLLAMLLHRRRCLVEALDALLVQLNKLLLLEMNDFRVLFYVVLEGQDKVDVECLQLYLREPSKEIPHMLIRYIIAKGKFAR